MFHTLQHEGSSANTELKAELFNVYEIINVGESTFVTLDGLDLTQSESYFVWVIGENIDFLIIYGRR